MKKAFVICTFLLVAGVLWLNQQQKPITQPAQAHTMSIHSSTQRSMLASLSHVARPIVRINQLDCAQYLSQQDCSTWSYSACSPAAMAELLNADGLNVRIADVLAVEAKLHEITPDLGMLNGVLSIQRTVASFGFQAASMKNPTLDEVITTANAGQPVIVGFPPALWDGGHVLVVRGGDTQSVYLTDSSRLNMQAMARARFLSYWVGFAVIVSPAGAGGQQ